LDNLRRLVLQDVYQSVANLAAVTHDIEKQLPQLRSESRFFALAGSGGATLKNFCTISPD